MRKFFTLFLILQTVLFVCSCENSTKEEPLTLTVEEQSQHSFLDEAYQDLDSIVLQKKQELMKYLEMAHSSAKAIRNDQLMNSFFSTIRDFDSISSSRKVPVEISQSLKSLKSNIQSHYLNKYLIFNDILFVDSEGDIFYSIRKQEQKGENIFDAGSESSGLSRQMSINPKKSFIDFQFCDVKYQPSGFFVEPVIINDETRGWFVFQFSIDKINNLFSLDKKIGSSGEVLLVNQERYMLTDSRFHAESTILKQKLAKENIHAKFAERKGHKSVVDYRGFRVISSFEVFTFFDSEWLIIAKINESEVLTKYFHHHLNDLQQNFHNSIKPEKSQFYEYVPVEKDVLAVEIDQFRRADEKERIHTQGVMTCTAVLVTYPGRFSYLAHISPYDKIYGENRTDLLGHMLKQIDYLEITKSEKQNLKFVVVSPHQKTIQNIVHTLIDEDYFLSQIKFSYNPKANYANLTYYPEADETLVGWNMEGVKSKFVLQKVSEINSIGNRLRKELNLI